MFPGFFQPRATIPLDPILSETSCPNLPSNQNSTSNSPTRLDDHSKPSSIETASRRNEDEWITRQQIQMSRQRNRRSQTFKPNPPMTIGRFSASSSRSSALLPSLPPPLAQPCKKSRKPTTSLFHHLSHTFPKFKIYQRQKKPLFSLPRRKDFSAYSPVANTTKDKGFFIRGRKTIHLWMRP